VTAGARRWLVRLARIAVTAALLVFVLRRVEWHRMQQIAREVRPQYVVILLLCSLGERLFGAWRWHLLLRNRHSAISLAAVTRLSFVSAFVGVFLPGAVGTYAVRAYGIARLTSDLGLSLASLLADRLFVALAMLLMVGVGLIAAPGLFPSDLVRLIAWAAALTTAVIFVAIHPRVGALLNRLLTRRWLQPLRRLSATSYAFMAEVRGRPLEAGAFFAAAVVLQLFRVAVVTAALRAVGIDVNPLVALVVVPVTMFALMIPITVAGLGVREVTFIYLLGLIGVPPEAAIASALLIYASAVLSTLPGAFFLSRGVLGRPASELGPGPRTDLGDA
jgi:glycosyltransferase 2 family protein